jgi:hypothetical protein
VNLYEGANVVAAVPVPAGSATGVLIAPVNFFPVGTSVFDATAGGVTLSATLTIV